METNKVQPRRSSRIGLRVPIEVRQAIQKVAEREKRTLSQTVCLLLIEALKRRKVA